MKSKRAKRLLCPACGGTGSTRSGPSGVRCSVCSTLLRTGDFEFEISGHNTDEVANVGERLLTIARANTNEKTEGRTDMRETSKARAVILCAVEGEYTAVQSYFKPEEPLLSKGAIGYKSRMDDGSIVVVLLLQTMGNLSSALETQNAIDVWRPQFLLLVGIAGGFTKSDRYLGDVIVADQIVYYELAKHTDQDTTLRPQVYRASTALISAAQAIAAQPYTWIDKINWPRPDGTSERVIPRVHVGPVLSGDKVVSSENFLQEFRDVWPGIVGVEMEGAGAALAAYRSETQPEFLMIKAICDWADSSKNDSWQMYAGHVSAAFALLIIEMVLRRTKTSLTSRGGRGQQVPQRELRVACTGPDRYEICERLYDGWEEIADYYEITKRERARFKSGREMIDVWEWLVARGNLDSLPSTLRRFRRDDVIRDFPCLTPR